MTRIETPPYQIRQRLDYQVVLELRVLHTYYHNLRCRDLQISPTPETAAKLRGFGLLFRGESDGFLLAADNNRDYTNPIFQQPETFEFQFKVTNPQFLNFTDIPYRSGQFHIFESIDGNDGALHPGHYVDFDTMRNRDVDGIQGVIRLRHDPQHPIVPMYWDSNTTGPKTHFIRFGSRETYFSYFLHGKDIDAETSKLFFVEKFEINRNSYTFNTPQSATLRNGTKGFRINSLEPLAMKESYTGQGTLVMRKRSVNPFEYRRSLPMPKPDMVVFDPVSKTFFSELFVKL